MDFKEITSKMMKKLAKADKHIERAKYCDDKEIAKIYHKMAQDDYEIFSMLHKLTPQKAKEYIGEEFNPEDKMFGVMHSLLMDWGHRVKEDIDNLKII